MKWVIKSIIFIQVIILCFSSAWAAGPANIYETRIAKFEMYNGSDWVTVFEGTSDVIDIASVDSGASAGEFLSGLTVPDGTYTQVRVTPHQTFKIKGNDGSNRYTTSFDSVTELCNYSNTAGDEDECEMTVTFAITPGTDTFSTPITVENGVPSHKVRVSFDISAAIVHEAGADKLRPDQPVATLTAIAIE